MTEEAIVRFDKRLAKLKITTEHIADNAITKEKIFGGGLTGIVIDQSLNRSSNTTYRNNTNTILLVISSIEYVGATDSTGYAEFLIGKTENLDTLVNNV
ncbi:MAG: hypothetical protein QXF79_01830, partial [Ignisphaera sp.]